MKNIGHDLLLNLDNATLSNRKVTQIGWFDVPNTEESQQLKVENMDNGRE